MRLSPQARFILESRYLIKDKGKVVEKPDDFILRVANAIADAESFYTHPVHKNELRAIAQNFFDLMYNLDFLPNSPTLMNAGRELNQLAACFVLPVEDSIEDIFESVKQSALIHKSGGGTGFSFSRIRPKNSLVSSTGGTASGPVSFMKVFDVATEAIKQGGTRRGANMAVLRVDHPDIREFITIKDQSNKLNNFNISVAVTTEFMQAVGANENYDLHFKGKFYGQEKALEILKLIAQQAWKNGEPGILFMDRINKDNPTPQLGYIEATNPCGELPLLPYEACNLGSINLENMVKGDGIDWSKLEQTVKTSVRFLDNVIDSGYYPLPEVSLMIKGNRKIGLGVMGWANTLYKLLIPYNSEEALALAKEIMSFIQHNAHEASKELAQKRGNFPNLVNSRIAAPKRNATCTAIAPTGTLSLIAGTSPGIEPVFALAFRKRALEKELKLTINPVFYSFVQKNFSGHQTQEILTQVNKTGSIANCTLLTENLRKVFVTAREITPEWHVKMQAAFQLHCDNAVSKTVNLPNTSTVEEVMDIFILAHQLNCKGITVYRIGSREEEALQSGLSK